MLKSKLHQKYGVDREQEDIDPEEYIESLEKYAFDLETLLEFLTVKYSVKDGEIEEFLSTEQDDGGKS